MDHWLNFVNTVYGGESCAAVISWKLSELFQIPPDRCFSSFYPNFYEYEMLIEREVCLFSVLFFHKITVNSLLLISVFSFSQHKNYVTVKLAMGCIQLNDKLVARLKIGLTGKQFWNESRGILPTRGPCCRCQVLHKFFHSKRIEWPSNLRGMNSMKFRISWPNTGGIKV